MKSNMIVILCDQMRRDAMSCAGDPNVSTPNIDRLAAEGVRFSGACSTYPVCVPTRFSLMTGQYAHTRQVPAIGWRMSPCERTIAHEFNDAGYETSLVGKWHLYGSHPMHPSDRNLFKKFGYSQVPRVNQGGFTKWRGFEFRNDHFDTAYFIDDDPTPHPIDGYQTDGLFDVAIRYVQEERDKHKPFFQIVSVEAPHPPLDVPEKYMRRWANKELQLRPNVGIEQYTVRGSKSEDLLDDLRTYYAMIENLDDNIGKLFKMLEAEGLKENTAIVFISDHGELMGSHGLFDKQYPYEEAVGVPFIVSFPNGGIPSNKVVSTPTCTEDWLPTFMGLVGLRPKSSYPGEDLTPLMKDDVQALARPGIMMEFVSEYREGMAFFDETWRGFRTERYKYTVKGDPYGAEPWQLFDLKNDPYEMENLINRPEFDDISRELHGYLIERMIETGDDFVMKRAWGYSGLNTWQ